MKPRLFFKKSNEIDKPLARWTKTKRGKTQITKTRNGSRDISNNAKEIKRTVRECYEQLYTKKNRKPK